VKARHGITASNPSITAEVHDQLHQLFRPTKIPLLRDILHLPFEILLTCGDKQSGWNRSERHAPSAPVQAEKIAIAVKAQGKG